MQGQQSKTIRAIEHHIKNAGQNILDALTEIKAIKSQEMEDQPMRQSTVTAAPSRPRSPQGTRGHVSTAAPKMYGKQPGMIVFDEAMPAEDRRSKKLKRKKAQHNGGPKRNTPYKRDRSWRRGI